MTIRRLSTVAATSSATKVRRQVAGRCAFPAASRNVTNGSSNTQVQQVHGFVLTDDVNDLAITHQNVYRSGASATALDGLSTVTIRSSLWDGVNTYPTYAASGSRDQVIEPGALATTAPLPAQFSRGQRLWLVRRITWASAPANFPAATVVSNTATEYNEWGTALTDRTADYSNSQFFTRSAGNFCVLPPVAMTATAAPGPVVGILGDSIGSDGSNDYNTEELDQGYAQGALGDARIPYVNLGTSGLASNIVMSSKPARSKLFAGLFAAGITHLFVLLATNDWANGRTAAQLVSELTTLKAEMAPRGIKVIAATAPPRTNGNTASAPAGEPNTFTQRALFNASLRANNGVGHGFFDLAALAEDPADSNRWRTDLLAATGVTVLTPGANYNQRDVLFLPGGGSVSVSTVSSGAITALTYWGGGGFLTTPASGFTHYRIFGNQPSLNGLTSGAGATFAYSGVGAVAATTDGVHPDGAMTRWLRQGLATAAPSLFAI